MKKLVTLSTILILAFGLKAQNQAPVPANSLLQSTQQNDRETEIKRNDAQMWLETGMDKYDQRDYKGAIIELDKAIDGDPDNSESWAYRGISKILTGQRENGCIDLSKAKELGDIKGQDVLEKLCKE